MLFSILAEYLTLKAFIGWNISLKQCESFTRIEKLTTYFAQYSMFSKLESRLKYRNLGHWPSTWRKHRCYT